MTRYYNSEYDTSYQGIYEYLEGDLKICDKRLRKRIPNISDGLFGEVVRILWTGDSWNLKQRVVNSIITEIRNEIQ